MSRVLFLCYVFCTRALKEYLKLIDNGFDVFVGHICGPNARSIYRENNLVRYIKKDRSITYNHRWNILVYNPSYINSIILSNIPGKHNPNMYGDGHSAQRIVEHIMGL